jgi:hypothetical protein
VAADHSESATVPLSHGRRPRPGHPCRSWLDGLNLAALLYRATIRSRSVSSSGWEASGRTAWPADALTPFAWLVAVAWWP